MCVPQTNQYVEPLSQHSNHYVVKWRTKYEGPIRCSKYV